MKRIWSLTFVNKVDLISTAVLVSICCSGESMLSWPVKVVLVCKWTWSVLLTRPVYADMVSICCPGQPKWTRPVQLP